MIRHEKEVTFTGLSPLSIIMLFVGLYYGNAISVAFAAFTLLVDFRVRESTKECEQEPRAGARSRDATSAKPAQSGGGE